jgi:hypothetical protein
MNTIDAFHRLLIFRDALYDNLYDDRAIRVKRGRNYLRFRRAFVARLKECDQARMMLDELTNWYAIDSDEGQNIIEELEQ